MKYFWELTEDQQERILNKLQPLPLFKHMKEDARLLLETSKNYMIDENLVVHIVIPEESEMQNA